MPKDKTEKKAHKKHASINANDSILVDEDVSLANISAVKKTRKEDVIINFADLSPIAQPLASKKLLKKLHKTIRHAAKHRHVKRGVKEVVKGIRKGEKGLLVLAADISPIDIISHLPVLSEEAKIPYVFITSKEDLGHASSTKRPTSCVMICPDMKGRKKTGDDEDSQKDNNDFRELYDECCREVDKLDTKVVF